MNVFNPEAPLKEMDLDDIETLKDRYLNTKFLLGQSRNPFPLKELPSIAVLQREGERVALDSPRGTSSTGAFGPEERTPEQCWACRCAQGSTRFSGSRGSSSCAWASREWSEVLRALLRAAGPHGGGDPDPDRGGPPAPTRGHCRTFTGKKGADVGPPAFVCLEPPSDHDHGPQEGGEEQGNKQPAQG